jgi:heme/copper-type cytochrome/quinol oxidase subunit 2
MVTSSRVGVCENSGFTSILPARIAAANSFKVILFTFFIVVSLVVVVLLFVMLLVYHKYRHLSRGSIGIS